MTDTPTNEPSTPTPPKAPVIDSSQSLTSQADKLLKIMGDTSEPKVEPKVETPKVVEPEGKKEEPKEEPKVEPVVNNLPVPDEIDDEPLAKPVELGTMEKFVSDKLPMLTTTVLDAEGNPKTVRFKDPAELGNFTLANDTIRSQFTVDVAAQLGRAKDALQEFNNMQFQENVKAFEVQEAQDVASDVARLQKQKILPEFKYEEDDPNFNSDPAVKTANEIYDLYKRTNDAYAKKYAGTNRTFRVSYADAADKYFASQARSANDSQKAVEQPTAPEKKTPIATKERQEIAGKVGSPQGGEPSTTKPKVVAGMTMNDINRLVRAEKI